MVVCLTICWKVIFGGESLSQGIWMYQGAYQVLVTDSLQMVCSAAPTVVVFSIDKCSTHQIICFFASFSLSQTIKIHRACSRYTPFGIYLLGRPVSLHISAGWLGYGVLQWTYYFTLIRRLEADFTRKRKRVITSSDMSFILFYCHWFNLLQNLSYYI